MKTLLSLCLLLINVIIIQAQMITIKGRVVDVGGEFVRFSMYNPFSSLARISEYLSEAYEIYTKEYTRKISDHLFFVTLNYRFSFGKKHRYDNSTMEDTEKSAILKAY